MKSIRAWTRAALRDVVYCAAICVWSVAAFAIAVSGLAVTVSLLIAVVGLAVWMGFAHAMRRATVVDRLLAGWQLQDELRATYRRPPSRAFMSQLKTVSSDPQIWKDIALLTLGPVVGFPLGLAVTTAAGMSVAMLAMPTWSWAVSHPQDEYGLTNLGLFTVDTPGEAMMATGIGLILIPVVLAAARLAARFYAAQVVRVLSS